MTVAEFTWSLMWEQQERSSSYLFVLECSVVLVFTADPLQRTKSPHFLFKMLKALDILKDFCSLKGKDKRENMEVTLILWWSYTLKLSTIYLSDKKPLLFLTWCIRISIMSRTEQAKEEVVHALSRKWLSILSLRLSRFSVTIPTLSTTVSGGSDSRYDSFKKQESIVSRRVWGDLKSLLADAAIK